MCTCLRAEHAHVCVGTYACGSHQAQVSSAPLSAGDSSADHHTQDCFFSLSRIYFTFKCVYVCCARACANTHKFVYMSAGVHGGQKSAEPLEQELQAVVIS